jgi:hypothetical protein
MSTDGAVEANAEREGEGEFDAAPLGAIGAFVRDNRVGCKSSLRLQASSPPATQEVHRTGKKEDLELGLELGSEKRAWG